MKIRDYIIKIVDNQNPEDMEKLGDILEDAITMLEKYNRAEYKRYKMCLYEMAYGKTLTKEVAEEWVKEMNPPGKWDFETTSAVRKQNNIIDIDEVSFYTVMNMLYSDMSNVLGEGDNASSLGAYVQATKDWLQDEDAADDKLYHYWRYVIQ